MVHVLVTAFGAFPGAPRNPTLAILTQLRAHHAARLARLGITLDLHVLPVRFGEVEQALLGALDRARPDIVLHLGLAGRRRLLSVEQRALNRLTTLRPDAGRQRASSGLVSSGGPAQRPSRWNGVALTQALNKEAPTRLSRDAGDYVCNQTLYLALAHFEGPAGFIHVPPPRPALSLAKMTKAVAAGLVQLALAHRVSMAGTALAKA